MKLKSKYKEGDIRIVKRFLLFPKVINRDIRWLEIAKYKQRFEFYISFIVLIPEWTDIEWID